MIDSAEPSMTRPALPSDEPFLRDLYACVRWPELVAVAWSDAEKRAFCDMQYTLQDRYYREQYPDTEWLVVLEHDVPVGRMYVTRSDDEIKVLDLALLPAVRGRGLGTRLMRTVVDEADRTRQRVSLFTEPGNPARRLYARLGFVARHASEMHVELVRDPVVPDRICPTGDAAPLTARD